MKTYISILVFVIFSFTLQSCVVKTQPAHYHSAKVVYVKHAPEYHKVVYVKGSKYYFWNGKYHRKTAKGYVVVKI